MYVKRLNFKLNFPAFGKFGSIAQQVYQNLFQAYIVGPYKPGQLRRNVQQHLQPLCLHLVGNNVDDLAAYFIYIAPFNVQLQLASLYLRKIQNVVNNTQQRVCRLVYNGKILLLGFVQRCFHHQVGKADHAVQRCPNFVAHVGQKL